MTRDYNLTGQDRKQLVGAISQILNQPMHYDGAPGFGYSVGEFHISKTGVLTGPDNDDLVEALHTQHDFLPVSEEAEESHAEPEAPAEPPQVAVYARLSRMPSLYTLKTPRGEIHIAQEFATCAEASDAGFSEYFSTALGTIYSYGDNHTFALVTANKAGDWDTTTIGRDFRESAPEAEPDCPENTVREGDLTPNRVVIEMPLDGFTPEKLDNLCKLVAAKEPLLKAALGVDTLPIQHTAETIDFPWFPADPPENAMPYAQLITALCRTAQTKQRVLAKPNENHPNMKFAMRTFLISLGLVGPEFKAIRKILTSTLPGNGAYSNPSKMKSKAEKNPKNKESQSN